MIILKNVLYCKINACFFIQIILKYFTYYSVLILESDNHLEEEQSNLKSPGIIRLSAIRDVIDKVKFFLMYFY